jgi:copper chaperone CopZ
MLYILGGVSIPTHNLCEHVDFKEDLQMEKETLSVPNISCGHCVMAIKNELSEMEGVKSVEGSPETKRIVVEWESPASLEVIKETLKEINYPAA